MFSTNPEYHFETQIGLNSQEASALFHSIKILATEHSETEKKAPSTHTQLAVDRYRSGIYSEEEFWSAMRFDHEHLVREVAFGEVITEFDITQELNGEAHGDGYIKETMNFLESNFVQEILRRGANPTRAITEHITLSRAREKLGKSAQQERETEVYMLITSPPDSVENGYHGIDTDKNWRGKETHHTFFFLMHAAENAEGTARIHTTQLRTMHNVQGLLDVHSDFTCPIVVNKAEPITCQIFANAIEIRCPKGTPPKEVLEYVQTILYKDQHKWVRKPEEMPQISNEEAFWKEFWVFFNDFYVAKARPIFHSITPDVLDNSELYTRKITELEDIFAFYFSAIEKRTQELNTNPLYERLLRRADKTRLLKEVFRRYVVRQSPQSLPLNEKSESLHTLFDLRQKLLRQEPLTLNEKIIYRSSTAALLSATNFVLGSGQCLVFAPITMPMTLLRSGSMLSSGSFPHLDKSLMSLTQQEQKRFFSDLKSLDYREITLVANGVPKTFMVPRVYLEGRGCSVVWDEGTQSELYMGPCISLLDPRESYALCMNQAEFDKLLSSLENKNIQQDLNVTEASLLNQSTTETEKGKIKRIFLFLRSTLIKSVLTLNDVINNDTINQTSHPELKKIIQRLQSSKSPFEELESIAREVSEKMNTSFSFSQQLSV